MQTVVVGLGDAVSTPEVCFSLRDAGFRPLVACRTEGSSTAMRWIDVDTFNISDPEVDYDATRRDLMSALAGHAVQYIFAADDAFLLIINDLQKSDDLQPVVHLGPGGAAADVALDKWVQVENARKAGFNVPDTKRSTMVSDVRQIALPFFMKPRYACEVEQGPSARRIAKRPSRLIESYDMYDDIVSKYTDHDFLLQQPVYGKGEGYFGLYWDGSVKNPSAHERVRMIDPHGSGSSACASRKPHVAEAESTQKLLESIGWQGVFMFETLVDDTGERWFVELNGRSWGSLALARRLGFEYPGWIAMAASGATLPDVKGAKDRLVVQHLGRDILHFLAVLRGPKTEMARKAWPGRLSTFLHVFLPTSPSRYYNYDPKHPLFFFRESMAYILNRLVKRKR